MAIAPLQIPGYQAAPDVDWSPLNQLGKTIQQNREKQTLADIGKGIADGTLSYKDAAGQIAGTGNLGATYQFLQLAEAKEKQARELEASNQFANTIGGLFGSNSNPYGGTTIPLSALGKPERPALPATDNSPLTAPAVTPAQPQAREPVQPSKMVWGDKEAEDAGLYERPAQPDGPRPMTLADLHKGAPGMAPPASNSTPAQPQAQPTPQSGSAASGPNISHVPQLLRAVNNPNLPAVQKEIAKTLLIRALDDTKTPERINFLQRMKEESGYKGTILDLERELRAAGKTDVNIDQRNETEESKAAGKGAGERRSAMFAAAGAAGKTLTNLARTEALLGRVSQGKIEPGRMSVSAWAKSLGLNDDVATSLGLDPKSIGSAQALQSLVNESVIGKIGSGGFPANNFSDADRAFITQIFPTLGDDPRANRIRVEAARRMANLDIQRAKDYQAWKARPENKSRGFEDFETDWSDKMARRDVFGDLRRDAEKVTGPARPEAGNTYDNPGPARAPAAAPQRQQTPNGIGWSIAQ